MRIVSGTLKGKSLRTPGGATTRPTSDRARQAIFNILEHAAWGPELKGARVLDVFAGSGALGFEALSRGAASVYLWKPTNVPEARFVKTSKRSACSDKPGSIGGMPPALGQSRPLMAPPSISPFWTRPTPRVWARRLCAVSLTAAGWPPTRSSSLSAGFQNQTSRRTGSKDWMSGIMVPPGCIFWFIDPDLTQRRPNRRSISASFSST